MTDKAFKEQLVEKLTSLVRTIEFDNRYTVKHPYYVDQPYADRPMEVYRDGKELFSIRYCKCTYDIDVYEPERTSITVYKNEGSLWPTRIDGPTCELFKKAEALHDSLADIFGKRERKKQEKEEKLEKEKEARKQQRLSEKQNAVLSYIDYITHRSK